MYASDIQTSLHASDVLLGNVMQSLSLRIFQIPVQELPDSEPIIVPSGSDQCGPSMIS
jgi:hypothetical protein